MIANILDADEATMRAGAQGETGMALFYDFAAASPSIERAFSQFFAELGWPRRLLNAVGILHLDNACVIQIHGERSLGFPITRRVRQGCPLFPTTVCHGCRPYATSSSARGSCREVARAG